MIDEADLPYSERDQGRAITDDFKDELEICKDSLEQNHRLWQYQACVQIQLVVAKNRIRELKSASSSSNPLKSPVCTFIIFNLALLLWL